MTQHKKHENEPEYTGKLVYKLGEELLEQEHPILTQCPPLIKYEKSGYLEPESREQLLQYHPEVVLYCPQIPPNTGTVARLCAAFSSTLHLIEPMGFRITEKGLRRAGLDYWQHVNVFVHQNWQNFLATRKGRRIIFIETGGETAPIDFSFKAGDLLVFGAETFGIPKEIIDSEIGKGTAHKITIPMFNSGVRSLNLANTVSIVLYLAVARLHNS